MRIHITCIVLHKMWVRPSAFTFNHRVFPPTKMESANKQAASECLKKAERKFAEGDLKSSLRLAEKSLRMYQSEEAKGIFIVLIHVPKPYTYSLLPTQCIKP